MRHSKTRTGQCPPSLKWAAQAVATVPRACLFGSQRNAVRGQRNSFRFGLRWFCVRCRRRCCAAAAWLSYRGRNRPPYVAVCSWGVLIGKCGPMGRYSRSTAVPLMPAPLRPLRSPPRSRIATDHSLQCRHLRKRPRTFCKHYEKRNRPKSAIDRDPETIHVK